MEMHGSQRVRLRARRRVEPPLLPSFAQRGAMISIFQAATNTELNDVRALMRAFVAWHRARHVEDLALIDRYFDAEAWEAELAGLPGKCLAVTAKNRLRKYHSKPGGWSLAP